MKQRLEGLAAQAENAGEREGKGGGRDCELVALLLEWILFSNILFLRKMVSVSVFVAPEGEKAGQASPVAAAES